MICLQRFSINIFSKLESYISTDLYSDIYRPHISYEIHLNFHTVGYPWIHSSKSTVTVTHFVKHLPWIVPKSQVRDHTHRLQKNTNLNFWRPINAQNRTRIEAISNAGDGGGFRKSRKEHSLSLVASSASEVNRFVARFKTWVMFFWADVVGPSIARNTALHRKYW